MLLKTHFLRRSYAEFELEAKINDLLADGYTIESLEPAFETTEYHREEIDDIDNLAARLSALSIAGFEELEWEKPDDETLGKIEVWGYRPTRYFTVTATTSVPRA